MRGLGLAVAWVSRIPVNPFLLSFAVLQLLLRHQFNPISGFFDPDIHKNLPFLTFPSATVVGCPTS